VAASYSDVWHCDENVGIATDVAVPEGGVLSQINTRTRQNEFPIIFIKGQTERILGREFCM